MSLSLNLHRLEEMAKNELLGKFGIEEEQIAWLSEDESTFGSAGYKQHDAEKDSEHVPSGDKNRAGAGTEAATHDSEQVLTKALRLRYPRDLSSLRNSSDPGALLVSPADLTGSPQASHTIPLTLGDKASGELDSPPAYAANQEAIRAQAALERIVERIHERRIQAVVVTASNSLDQLFLLDYLRRSMPDVRLVTVDADEFMMQRPAHVSLIGTLVLTGLPTLPGEETNQIPKKQESDLPNLHVGLPSSDATGEFLGIRLLLQRPDVRERAMARLTPEANESHARGQDDYDKPGGKAVGESPEATDRGLPIEDIGSFIEGRFGPEPLEGSNLFTHYPIGEAEAYVAASVNPFPTGWLFVLLFIGLLTGWHLWAARISEKPLRTVNVEGKDEEEVWNASKWAYPPEPDEPETLKGELGWEPLKAYRKYYLYIACNQVTLLEFAAWTVTAVLLVNFGPLVFQGAARMDLPLEFTTANFVWILILFGLHTWLLGMAALESFSRMRSFGRGGDLFADQRVAAFLTHIFFAVSVVVWLLVLTRTVLWHPNLGDIAAVALRCASPMHGLSPFVPFAALLLAYLMWAWLNLERLGAACSRRVWVGPDTEQKDGVFAKDGVLVKLHQRLHEQLQSCFPEPDALQAFLGIAWIVGLFITGAWNATAGLDGLWFHLWIFGFGMLMLLYTCAVEIVATYRRWWAFKALLDYLERSPIATEFSGAALQMEIGSMKIWQAGKMPDTLLIQTHILDMLPAKDREFGKTLVCDWLTQNSKSLRVRASTTRDLSKLLDGPLVEQGKILEQPRPDITPKSLYWSLQARYLTLRYLALMPYAMMQIRNSLTFVVWGFAATVLCVASYPFQGTHAIEGFISVGCLGTLGGIAYLLVSIERHPLLSRLEGSAAGKASFLQVAGQLLSIGGLPLIAVLASQFPAMGDFLLSWVRPVLEAGH